MELTPAYDLRGGRPCWLDPDDKSLAGLASGPLPDRVEIAIVGAGIMGAMLAEQLSREGRQVALIDRRPPAHGSTAASTALVLWATDMPLSHLTRSIGKDRAAAAWRRVHRAVRNLDRLVGESAIDCGWMARPELYLAGGLLDPAALAEEGAIRRRAGLPSQDIAPAALHERFDLPPRAGLISDDAFAVDPLALTLGLLMLARQAGATVHWPAHAVWLDHQPDHIDLHIADGSRLAADKVILATGYEAARWYLPDAFRCSSSFAIATAPGTAPGWRERAMIWEAASPYLYARDSAEGRIIVGGADEELVDPIARDRLLGAKRGVLEAAGAALLGLDSLTADCAWSAAFGNSPDGLPAIGRAANAERLWIAYGFGGNGISFARLGAELMAAELRGEPDADAGLFDPYRFG